MSAPARRIDDDCYTCAANDADFNGGPWTRTKYTYDGNGKRIKTTQADGTVEYALYDRSGQLVYTEKGGEKIDYLSLGGQTLVKLSKVGTTTTPTYLHPDLLGSPRKATNQSKAVVWKEQYDPYGLKLNGVSEKIGYTGHAYDSESGYTYMQARFYDPAAGRFLSSDPIHFTDDNPFTFNRYSYANNNPYRYIDPNGMCTGSRIENTDGTCASTGGFTTGTSGAAEGQKSRAQAQSAQSSSSSNAGQNVTGQDDSIESLLSNETIVLLALPIGRVPGIIGRIAEALGLKVVSSGTRAGIAQALSRLRAGRSPGVKLVRTEAELNSLFSRLSAGGRPVTPATYRGQMVELPDGTRVGFRASSKSGGPALDVHMPDGTQYRVHVQP